MRQTSHSNASIINYHSSVSDTDDHHHHDDDNDDDNFKAPGCEVNWDDLPRICASISVYGACLSFGAGLGILGAAIPELAGVCDRDATSIGDLFAYRGVGFLLGTLFTAWVLELNIPFVSKQSMCTISILWSGTATFLVSTVAGPTMWRFRLLRLLFVLQGFGYGGVDALSLVALMEMWGQRAQPWSQVKSLMSGIGGILGPFLLNLVGFERAFYATALIALTSILGLVAESVVTAIYFPPTAAPAATAATVAADHNNNSSSSGNSNSNNDNHSSSNSGSSSSGNRSNNKNIGSSNSASQVLCSRLAIGLVNSAENALESIESRTLTAALENMSDKLLSPSHFAIEDDDEETATAAATTATTATTAAVKHSIEQLLAEDSTTDDATTTAAANNNATATTSASTSTAISPMKEGRLRLPSFTSAATATSERAWDRRATVVDIISPIRGFPTTTTAAAAAGSVFSSAAAAGMRSRNISAATTVTTAGPVRKFSTATATAAAEQRRRARTLSYATPRVVRLVQKKEETGIELCPHNACLLLSHFTLWYIGLLMLFGGWISQYALMRGLVSSYSAAAFFATVFYTSSTAGSLLSIPMAALLSTSTLLRLLLLLLSIGSVLFLFSMQSYSVAVVAVCLIGASLSCIYPLVMRLGNDYGFTMDGNRTIALVVGGNIGESVLPSVIGALMNNFGCISLPISTAVITAVMVASYLLAHSLLLNAQDAIDRKNNSNNYEEEQLLMFPGSRPLTPLLPQMNSVDKKQRSNGYASLLQSDASSYTGIAMREI